MPDKTDVISTLKQARDELLTIAEAAPAEAWSNQTYEDGWTCRSVLSHIASTSAPAGFLLMMSRLPAGSGGGPAFDNEAFNRDQVKLRADRSVAEVLDEIRANVQRDITAVEAASDEDLQRQWTAPWGNEGTVAQIIIDSVNGHLGGHIADLRGALAAD